MCSRPACVWLLGALLVATAGSPSSTAAQGQSVGSIRGRVTVASNARPLSGAQLSIAGTGLGALTTNNGEFVIGNVPAGQRTVRVEMLGYSTAQQEVTVAAGEVTTVDFALESQALALDEIVVTGTAGGTQRRAIGNVVDQISAASIVETSPAVSVNQLIQQRSAGVQLMGGSGTVGGGAPIHIRGVSSMELDQTPIIFVDGVRVDDRPDRGPSQRGGSRLSAMDDINLDDVESIEIIKGPAAATLYGTEASNGVIQIVTKRGREGPAQFDVAVRYGTHFLRDPAERVGWQYGGAPYEPGGQLDSLNLYVHESENGPWGDPFKYGSLNSVDMSVRGGAERIRYFVSAGYSREVGVVSYNWQKLFTTRSNVDAVLSNTISLNASIGYTNRDYRAMQVTNPTDHFGNLVWGGPDNIDTKWRGWLNSPPEGSEEVDARTAIGRTTGSLELRHTPFEWLTNRLVVGLDVTNDKTSTLYPRHPDGATHWWGTLSLGSKAVTDQENRVTTVDWGTTGSYGIPFFEGLRGATSFGLQYYKNVTRTLGATGTNFAAPPLTTVSAGAVRAGSESFVENATVGLYVQQQLDWRNRVFLTAAVRGDDNSAFGAEYEAAVYPKLSATWVMHEEPWWNLGFMNQLRLRAAWGAAGRQPDAFAAVRLYAPVTGFGDQPGIEPSEIGNDQLKPEKSEELEVGFDIGLLNNRVEVIFTRYDRVVKDAMAARTLPPSEGFPGSQIVNLGRVKAWGNELSVNTRVVDRARIGWDVGVNFATMKNRIEDLGPLENGLGSNRLGYSIGDIFWPKVLSAEFVSGDHGPVKNIMCDSGTGELGLEMGGEPVLCGSSPPQVFWGHSQPTWQLNINQMVRLGESVRLEIMADATGGHRQSDSTGPAKHTSYCTTRECRLQIDPIVQSYRAIGRNPLGYYEAGFAKLREVSLSYRLPEFMVSRVGARSGSVSVAGRNLAMIWTKANGFDTPRSGWVPVLVGESIAWDPETRSTGDLSNGYQTTMPPLTSAVLTVRMSF
jgi:TonB-linked SusC/RagA family outer membrane protein